MLCRRAGYRFVLGMAVALGGLTVWSTASVRSSTTPDSSKAGSNLVLDGGFEFPLERDQPPCFKEYNSQSIGAWLVAEGSIDHATSCRWRASEGSESVDMNGSSAGQIYQTIQTPPGHAFQIHYALAGDMEAEPEIKDLDVGWYEPGFRSGEDFHASYDAGKGQTTKNMGWVCPTYQVFSGTASQHLIIFQSNTFLSNGSASAAGPVIDDVRVISGTAVTVEQVHPNTFRPGFKGKVAITGTFFAKGAAAKFSNRAIRVSRTKFHSANRVVATVSVSKRTKPGASDVTVRNKDGGTDTCGASAYVR